MTNEERAKARVKMAMKALGYGWKQSAMYHLMRAALCLAEDLPGDKEDE